ncbi:hypothetical protein LguiB_004525 [Lonicera macranthoides]
MGDSNPRSYLRCPHCAGPLTKDTETSSWTIAPLIRDSFSMIGSAVGGTASAFYGFNHGSPHYETRIRSYHKQVDNGHINATLLLLALSTFMAPPVIVFSSACAGLAGGAVPAVAQLASSSYHAIVSSPSLPPPQSSKKTR